MGSLLGAFLQLFVDKFTCEPFACFPDEGDGVHQQEDDAQALYLNKDLVRPVGQNLAGSGMIQI